MKSTLKILCLKNIIKYNISYDTPGQIPFELVEELDETKLKHKTLPSFIQSMENRDELMVVLSPHSSRFKHDILALVTCNDLLLTSSIDARINAFTINNNNNNNNNNNIQRIEFKKGKKNSKDDNNWNKPHNFSISCLSSFSKNHLISGSHDNTLKLWNLNGITTKDKTTPTLCASIVQNGTVRSMTVFSAIIHKKVVESHWIVVTGTGRGSVEFYDLGPINNSSTSNWSFKPFYTIEKDLNITNAHLNAVTALLVFEKCGKLVTTSASTIKIWNFKQIISDHHPDSEYDPNHSDESLPYLNCILTTDRCLVRCFIKLNEEFITYDSSWNTRFLSISTSNLIHIWHVHRQELEATIDVGLTGGFSTGALLPSNSCQPRYLLVSATLFNYSISLIDLITKQLVRT